VYALGVAFNAGIGGIRMLDGDVTDSVEASSLGMVGFVLLFEQNYSRNI
jgi:hypothetical protein